MRQRPTSLGGMTLHLVRARWRALGRTGRLSVVAAALLTVVGVVGVARAVADLAGAGEARCTCPLDANPCGG